MWDASGVRLACHADTFGMVITQRVAAADWWRAEPMEIASLFISVAIAVAPRPPSRVPRPAGHVNP